MYTCGRTEPVITCRGWPADMPSRGHLHSTEGARSRTSNTELEKAASEEGKISLNNSAVPFSRAIPIHASGQVLLNWRTHLVLADRLVWWNTVQGVIDQGGTSQGMGKENVDPAPSRRLPRKPSLKKVCTNADTISMCFGAHRTLLSSFRAANTEICCVRALKC